MIVLDFMLRNHYHASIRLFVRNSSRKMRPKLDVGSKRKKEAKIGKSIHYFFLPSSSIDMTNGKVVAIQQWFAKGKFSAAA